MSATKATQSYSLASIKAKGKDYIFVYVSAGYAGSVYLHIGSSTHKLNTLYVKKPNYVLLLFFKPTRMLSIPPNALIT